MQPSGVVGCFVEKNVQMKLLKISSNYYNPEAIAVRAVTRTKKPQPEALRALMGCCLIK
jgi:hypothetical protein